MSGSRPKGVMLQRRTYLSIRHMRMIVALEEHGRISAAAQVMNISQPAALRMISEMGDR